MTVAYLLHAGFSDRMDGMNTTKDFADFAKESELIDRLFGYNPDLQETAQAILLTEMGRVIQIPDDEKLVSLHVGRLIRPMSNRVREMYFSGTKIPVTLNGEPIGHLLSIINAVCTTVIQMVVKKGIKPTSVKTMTLAWNYVDQKKKKWEGDSLVSISINAEKE